MSIHILVATGGEWEDAWKSSLIASHDRDLLVRIQDSLVRHQQIHQAAEQEYKGKVDAHMQAWLEIHPDPRIQTLPRPFKKPKAPQPPPEYSQLMNLPKKERKNHPLVAEWKAALDAFDKARIEWNRIDRELLMQEIAPHEAWSTLRFEEETRFREENFHPESGFLLPYTELLSKYEHTVLNADDFSIKEVEEI